MEGLNAFDLDGLLTEDEAREVFSGNDRQQDTPPEKQEEGGEDETPDESVIENADAGDNQQEIVGNGNIEEREDAGSDASKGSSSPDVFYSSIARAAKNDGIFSNLSDEFIDSIKGPEDFGEALEQEVAARLSEADRLVHEMRKGGATPEDVQKAEGMKKTLDYLKGIDATQLQEESEEGEKLRKQIMYNDFITRGFTNDRAMRELKKSFGAGTDIEDAQDALESLTKYYDENYSKMIADQKKRRDEAIAAQRKAADDYRKMVLDEEIVLGDQKLSKQVRQKIYDATQKPVYKDPDTGRLLTELQKFQKENPLEFMKQLGMWYVLTNGGKDVTGFVKDKLKSEKHKAMRELETKIISNSNDGALRYVGGGSGSEEKDILLSDDWK